MSNGFICAAEPDYGWIKKLKEMEPHQFQTFRSGARSIKELLPVTQAELKDYYSYGGEMLMDSDEVEVWTAAGIELRMKRFKGGASNSAKLPDVIYQVSIANVGLMQVQTVEVLEDLCTDELQKWLNKGWRILAVCPPNDTRRPTYVMGHFDREPDGTRRR